MSRHGQGEEPSECVSLFQLAATLGTRSGSQLNPTAFDLKSTPGRKKLTFLSKFSNMKRLILIAIGAIAAHIGKTQSITPTEQQLVRTVESNMHWTYRILEESVNINSGTFNIPGVRATGDHYAKELRALGFNVEWVKLPDSLRRAGHLVATRQGKKGKKVLLIGHLDTVFEPEMPANPYRKVNETTVTGQGVVDMKGGNVMVIAALKALHEQKLLDDATITVYFTGDEENVGQPFSVSRADLIERAKQHDVALAFEAAGNMNLVATARRGSGNWTLRVEGRQGHSSGIFLNQSYGAVFEASRILTEFRQKLSMEKYLSFNPGLMAGGSELNYSDSTQSAVVSGKTNIISPRAVVLGDLRYISDAQKDRAKEKMKAIAAKSLKGTSATIRFQDRYPPMPPTAGNRALVKQLSAVSLALGYGPVQEGDPATRGAGDVSFVAKYLDCLDGLGASGSGAHAPGETIDLALYPKLIKRATVFLYRLTR